MANWTERKLIFNDDDLEIIALIKREVKSSKVKTEFMKDLLKYVREYGERAPPRRESSDMRRSRDSSHNQPSTSDPRRPPVERYEAPDHVF